MVALRKEHEIKFKNWIRAMALFIVIRTLALLFQSIVNDLYFLYHQTMLFFWFIMNLLNVFAFLIVISNYQELTNITRLEDMARLKLSTISSLNASRSLSHHSLDSCKGANIVNSHPSPSVSLHGTPAFLRGSTSSTDSYNHYYPQPSPRLGNPPSAAGLIPLAAFGLNLNPNGTYHSSSRSGHHGSYEGGPLSGGRGSTPSTAPI